MSNSYPWLWDVDMDRAAFERCLRGEAVAERFDPDWALVRLLEYAPYREIRRLLPRERFLQRWPELAPRIRSPGRREGLDFLRAWLSETGGDHHE